MAKRKERFNFIKILLAAADISVLANGCTYTEKERYMNFLADLDLINRFEMSFDVVSKGKPDGYLTDEIEVLKQDVASYENPNENAAEANRLLLGAADLLSHCVKCLKTGDMYNYEINLARARECYARANALMSMIKEGAENV